MKTKVLVFSGIATIVILFATFAPANMKDKLIGIVQFTTDERQCFNLYKDDFTDPDSAYVSDSFVWSKQDEIKTGTEYPDPVYDKYDATITVEVFAKNRMGGYVKEYVKCPLVNGHFDSHEAFIYKTSPTPVEQLAVPAPAIEPAPADLNY